MKLEQLMEIAYQVCGLRSEEPSGPVVVGVSGGPDSLCLLDGLAQLRLPLVVAHFDHQLRPESGQDAESVRSLAARMGLPFVLGSQNVAAFARQEQRSIEEAARVLRYRFLFEQARQHAAQAVAVGHTADDQVETVLMHLLRGSGLSGLTGMAYRSLAPEWDARIPLVRPLLGVWRSETLAWCGERDLVPLFDPSNTDTIYARNRLRAELIPFLETFNPRVREAIWRTARALAGDAQVVQAAVQQAWQDCLESPAPGPNGPLALRLERFRSLLPGLQRGVLRQATACLRPGLRDVDFAAIERGLAFAARPAPTGSIDLVDGLRLWVEGSRLLLAGPGPLPAEEHWPSLPAGSQMVLPVPGALDLPGGWRLEATWQAWDAAASPAALAATPWEAWLDIDPAALARAGGQLALRPPLPGDRFQPLGMQGRSLKLSDFWINHKLPRRARAGWPLLLLGETILWVPGYRPAHGARVTEHTRRALHLRLYRLVH